MTEPCIGFSVLHERRLASDTTARDAALRLLGSPSWVVPVRYFLSVATSGHKLLRKPGMIPGAKLMAVADEALQSEQVSHLTLASAANNGPGYRNVNFSRAARSLPFSLAYAKRPTIEQGLDSQVEEWVAEVLVFFEAVGGSTGVIPIMETTREVTTECSEAEIIHEGVLCHPFPEEHARMHDFDSREQLGTKYMRFPRWGTLVNREHVAKLGGVEAITRTVEPAVIRELSGGIYFQLTSSVATAMSEEAMAKQRRFTELAEPLLPPPPQRLTGG